MKTLFHKTLGLIPIAAIATLGMICQAQATGTTPTNLTLVNPPLYVYRYHNFTLDGRLTGSTRQGYQPIANATIFFESYDVYGSRLQDRTTTTNRNGEYAFNITYGKKDSYRVKYYIRYKGSPQYRPDSIGPRQLIVRG